MAEETPSQAIAEMSFEAALEELETIVRQLEDGKSALDDAISAYERGAALKKHCEAKLREAQMKVDKIVLGDAGKVSVESASGLSE
jgi:exodeoxyribonuclease VII small subunit